MEEDLIKNLRDALQHAPQNVPLRVQLGQILAKQKEWQEAESAFKLALEFEPHHVPAQRGLAQCYFHTQRYSAAIVVLESIVRGGDAQAEDFRWLAKAHLQEGSTYDAQEAYGEALKRDPQSNDPELDRELRMPSMPPGMLDGDEFDEDEDWDDDFGADNYQAPKNLFIEKPDLGFEDVGGLEGVKREIDLKIIKPLQNADLYKAYGKKVGGGILLYGPPGCGKTFLARATAGQVDAKFISIGINDVLDMWMGNSERRLHDIFEAAAILLACYSLTKLMPWGPIVRTCGNRPGET